MSSDSILKRFGNPPTKDQGYAVQAVANPGHELDVVGEYYRENAVESAFNKTNDNDCSWAVLRPEPANKHDENAVAVHVKGHKVGFLSSEDAELVQSSLIRHHSVNRKRVACPAFFDDPRDGETIQVTLMLDLQALLLRERKPINWKPLIPVLKWIGIAVIAYIAIRIFFWLIEQVLGGVAFLWHEVTSFLKVIF